MNRRAVVYLSCPMRLGDWTDNVVKASKVGADLMRKGYTVINPMGSWLLNVADKVDNETWLENDYGAILVSDYVFRIPGASEYGDLEVDFAIRHDKDYWTDLGDFYRETSTSIEVPDPPEEEMEEELDITDCDTKTDTKKLESLDYRGA